MEQALPTLSQYEKAEELEQYLGDMFDPTRPLSAQRTVALDELEQFPQQACDEIDRWGFHLHYIPTQFGGRFRSFDELFSLLRLLARRDVTVVVAHAKTYLGSICVWLKGSEQQKKELARIIESGEQVALALTE